MKRKILSIIALGLIIGTGFHVYARRGGGNGAAIGLGAGLGGFFLGRATAPRNEVVRRETVYVEQPARTVTVEDPRAQRELRSTQDQLVQERSRRLAIETELVTLRGKYSDLERDHRRLARKNRKYKKQLQELKDGTNK